MSISNDCLAELRAFQEDYRKQHGEELADGARRDFIDAYFAKHDTADCNQNAPNYVASFEAFNEE